MAHPLSYGWEPNDDIEDVDLGIRTFPSAYSSGPSLATAMTRPFGQKHPLADPKLVEEFLGQDRAWAAATGYIAIRDMEPSHALNAARFILERSLQVCLAVYVDGSVDAKDAISSEAWRVRFLLEQPLVKALLCRANTAAEELVPWAGIGE